MIHTIKDVLQFEGELNGIRRAFERFTEKHFNDNIEESWEALKCIAA